MRQRIQGLCSLGAALLAIVEAIESSCLDFFSSVKAYTLLIPPKEGGTALAATRHPSFGGIDKMYSFTEEKHVKTAAFNGLNDCQKRCCQAAKALDARGRGERGFKLQWAASVSASRFNSCAQMGRSQLCSVSLQGHQN